MTMVPALPRPLGRSANGPGSSLAHPHAGNSDRPFALLRGLPKGVK